MGQETDCNYFNEFLEQKATVTGSDPVLCFSVGGEGGYACSSFSIFVNQMKNYGF